VTVNDTLPNSVAGPWTITSQPAGNPCSITGSTLNCAFGDLASGQSRTVTVKATTSFAACTVYDNTATAASTKAPNASDDASVTCEKPNLSVNKTGNGTINAGEDVQFDIVTSNGGPGTATAVTLNDNLPNTTAGPWTISSQPAGDPCSITGATLSCAFGDLASGQSRTVTVKAATSFAACTTYNNTATASASNHPNAGDDASVTCEKPNLTVNKTGNGTVNAGEDVQFSVVVSNAGPGTATAATLSDNLPNATAGPWTISSQPAGDPCSITGNTLSCAFGDLVSGASRTVTIKAPTSFAACTVYVNNALGGADNSPSIKSEDATVNCLKPNLTVNKTGNGTVNAGEDVQFDVVTSNSGPGTAKSVTLSDPLPGGTAGAWTITSQPAGNPCSITAGTLNCSFGDLASGTSRTVTVKAATSFAACAVYNNTATAASTNHPNAADDATVTCEKPNLSVEKTSSATVNAGEAVEFAISVRNDGPGTAKSVALNDPLPTGTAGPWTISSQPAGDPCSITGSTLNCSFGDLASGASRTVTVKAATNYENCTVYDNTATASSTNAPNASDDATVTCQKPKLTVTKTGNGTVDAGQDIRFTIKVKNGGPGTAKSVTLSDPLPNNVAGGWKITDQPSGNPCSISGGSLKCSFGDLPAGAVRTIKIKAPTSNVECSVYENTATAIATNAPKASDDATVRCNPPKPNIVLKKTADRKRVFAGDTVKYAIWYRNTVKGSVARDLKICDRLPSQMTIVDTNNGFFENGQICWKVAELGYSEDWVHFHFRARVNEGVGRGTKLKNVVTLGKKKASWTVVVKRPQGVKGAGGGGGKTPVTG
jgi:uncharacterized repeat protein (TIGR01451 family)